MHVLQDDDDDTASGAERQNKEQADAAHHVPLHNGLALLGEMVAIVRGDAVAIRDKALDLLESIGVSEGRLKIHSGNADASSAPDAAAMCNDIRFLRSAKKIGLTDVLDRIGKLHLENILDKKWSGLATIKNYARKMQRDGLMSECLERIAFARQIHSNPNRPAKAFLSLQDVMFGQTTGDSCRAVLSFKMNAKHRMGQHHQKSDTLLLASVARLAAHPRSLINIVSTSPDQATVELFGAGPLAQTLKALRSKDAELRELCPFFEKWQLAERHLRAVRLAIYAPRHAHHLHQRQATNTHNLDEKQNEDDAQKGQMQIDSEATSILGSEETRMLETYVLPALAEMCCRESLNVHFEWDFLTHDEFVSQVSLFSPNLDPDYKVAMSECAVSWAPTSDADAFIHARAPFVLILAGHSLQDTSNIVERESEAVECGVQPSKSDDTTLDQQRFIREFFLVTSDTKGAGRRGGEDEGKTTASSHAAGIHRSAHQTAGSKQSTQQAPEQVQPSASGKRPSRTQCSQDGNHDDIHSKGIKGEPHEWRLGQAATRVLTPHALRQLECHSYATNWQHTEKLMLEKHANGQRHQTAYRLADFGHAIFNSISSMLVKQYPADQLANTCHEQHVYSQKCHYQKVMGGVTVGAAGTQDAVVEAVMGQMRERTACRVRLVGPAGCGKSSLLAVVAGRLQEVCATSGRVVYLCKMAWQSERQFMRVLVREVVEDEGADADAMSLRDALRLLDASRRLFLIVDGLSAEEQDMLSATLLYSGTECLVSLATACSTEPRQEASSDRMIAVGRLTRPEQYAILTSRAADLALELSLEDLEGIAAKQDATSPQYLILALHYINLRRHVAHAGPAIPHLPARTADLIASDAGLLALLEQKHGKQVVKYAGCCLAYFPAVCSRDVVKLCQLQGITTTLEVMSLIMHQLHALRVSCILQLPSAGNQAFYAMDSKVIGKAVLERYGFIHHNGLEMARTCLVQLLHLNVETDARKLRGLVHNLRHMPNSGRLLQVGSLLEAEDALTNQPDFRCPALAYLCLRPALAVSQMEC